MTIFVIVFLAFGIAFLIGLNWADARRYLPTVKVVSDAQAPWCPLCRDRYRYTGEGPAAFAYHRQFDCEGARR